MPCEVEKFYENALRKWLCGRSEPRTLEQEASDSLLRIALLHKLSQDWSSMDARKREVILAIKTIIEWFSDDGVEEET